MKWEEKIAENYLKNQGYDPDFEPDGNCGTGGYQVQLRFTKQ